MTQKELSELTDQELLDEAKKMKSTYIINAALIGFMIGIIIFSVVKNSLVLFTLIPLFFVFKITCNSKKDKALNSFYITKQVK
jgi:type IV secretory pathway VirB3-like protein